MTLPNPPPTRLATVRSMIGLAVILAGAACGSSALAPTTPSYVMTGTVRVATADGALVAGADVRILESPPGGTPTLTDENGEFRLPALLAGRHLIEVSKAGFVVWETEFDVFDRDLRLDVLLQVTSAAVSPAG